VSVEPPQPPTKPRETQRERLLRHGHRTGLYASAILVVALIAVLVVLISRNNESARLDWVFGSTHASLVWIILAAAVLGWLLGLVTGAVFHRRTRTPR
jgi:uncharacterized integral membrane protein